MLPPPPLPPPLCASGSCATFDRMAGLLAGAKVATLPKDRASV